MKKILIGIGIALLLLITYLVIDMVRGTSNDYYETHILRHTLQSEFSDKFIENLEVIECHKNKKGDVISSYNYDNHFHLYTWKLTPYAGVNLSMTQEENDEEIEMDQWAVYLELYSSEYPIISFSAVRDFKPTDEIYFMFDNDDYKRDLLKSTLLSYSKLNFEKISISGSNDTREVIINSGIKIEDAILIIQKDTDGIIIYLMYSPDNTRIPPLNDLVEGIKLP